MTNENLIELLKGNFLQQEDWRIASQKKGEIINEFSDRCNSFNRDLSIVETLRINPQAKKNFVILACACAIFMGYSWKCEEISNAGHKHWDARNKDSQRFCYIHLDDFYSLFKEYTGVEFPFSAEPQYLCFDHDHRLPRRSKLNRELNDFTKDHPTLQQTMIRLFIKIMDQLGIRQDIFSNAAFPFI